MISTFSFCLTGLLFQCYSTLGQSSEVNLCSFCLGTVEAVAFQLVSLLLAVNSLWSAILLNLPNLAKIRPETDLARFAKDGRMPKHQN